MCFCAGEEAFEIWFDGGTGPFNDTMAAVVRNRTRFQGNNRSRSICHSCFPFTQDDDIGAGGNGYGVRWMGNEEGVMPLPSWGALDNVFQQVPYNGDPYGELFQPPSVDTVLREHFWWVRQFELVQCGKKSLLVAVLDCAVCVCVGKQGAVTVIMPNVQHLSVERATSMGFMRIQSDCCFYFVVD